MASNKTVTEPASTISRILKEAQICSTSLHPSLIQELVDCRRQYLGFFEHWMKRLQPFFLVTSQRPAVEQAMQFCAQVVVYQDSQEEECDEFADACLRQFLEWCGAADKVVRYRSTQMVHEVMQRIPEDALSDDLVGAVVRQMLFLMQDKFAAVRTLAARSLWRIAVATDPDAPENGGIIAQYREVLETDEIAEVRKTVVTLMPAISSTVADVAACTADIHESVRRAAFLKLGTDFPINSLSISQRASVLGRGLLDRVPAVKAACFRMLKHSWLRRDCGGDVLRLLKLLDVETHFKVAETIMEELLAAGVVELTDDNSLIPFFRTDNIGRCQLLEAEEALYWRTICQFLHNEQQARCTAAAMSVGVKAVVDAENAYAKQDAIEKILPPSVVDYVQLVERHIQAGQHYQFTCQQLLKLGKLLDFTDTSSRKIAGVLLQNLLLGGIYSPENEEHVGDGGIAGDKEWEEAIVDFGKSVHAAPGEWITVMIELVEKLGRPCREGGAYPLQWLKCLNMAGLLLQDMDSACQLVGSVIEPTELVDALLLSAVKHIHTEVQKAGLRCLGFFCHLDEKPSPKIIQALRLALSSPQETVRNMAVKATFDLIICHGVGCIDDAAFCNQLASEPGTGGKGSLHTRIPMIDMMLSWLDVDAWNQEAEEDKSASHDSEKTTTVVAEGFAKLLIRGKAGDRICEQHAILQKLLLLYFNSKTAEFPRMNQCLGIFFENYTAVSAEHKLCLSKVFVPVVRCIWVGEGNTTAAKQRSKLVSQFMLQLMVQSVRKQPQQVSGAFPDVCGEVENGAPDEGHEDLAITIGAEVRLALQQPKFPSPKPYAEILYRIVSRLQFRETQQEKIKYMQSIVDRTLEFLLKDRKQQQKTLSQQLRTLRQSLRALDRTPDRGLTDEELSLLTETLLPTLVQTVDDEVMQAPVAEPSSARRKTTTRSKKKRRASPTDSETSSPEIYTPVPRDRRRGRVLQL